MTRRAGRAAVTAALFAGAPGGPAAAAAPAEAGPWAGGVVPVGQVDSFLESTASLVFDEVERKTLVRFRRGDPSGLSVGVSTIGAASSPAPRAALCCFDPSGGAAVQRELMRAVLRALGVGAAEPDGAAEGGTDQPPPPLLRAAEAEALNALYATEVLPAPGTLPARVEVGVWQLSHGASTADWEEMLGGRGRRFVAGAMRWARELRLAGQAPSVVGALPAFVFHRNKAEVVLLGPESAELAPRSALPPEPPDEGLGEGIRRATLHARGLRGRGFVGGVPTHLGDGSALLLRASFAQVALATGVGNAEDLDEVLREHHSAAAAAQVSSWAQGHGALMGLPSFVAQPRATPPAEGRERAEGAVPPAPLEVLVLRGRGQPEMALPGGAAAAAAGAGGGGPSLQA
ncbi:unnamed protein product, partial [Prorocentrum cordatum]